MHMQSIIKQWATVWSAATAWMQLNGMCRTVVHDQAGLHSTSGTRGSGNSNRYALSRYTGGRNSSCLLKTNWPFPTHATLNDRVEIATQRLGRTCSQQWFQIKEVAKHTELESSVRNNIRTLNLTLLASLNYYYRLEFSRTVCRELPTLVYLHVPNTRTCMGAAKFK